MILHLVVMYKAVIAAVALVLLAPLAASSFATILDVRIHSGSSSPYTSLTFYPPSVTGYVGDTLQIGNGDNVEHSVTSGTPEGGPNGKFDSGPLVPGQYFTYILKDSDVGVLHYYDKDYTWMIGTVYVQEASPGFKAVHNVGQDAGDGNTKYDVQYSSVKDIVSSSVNTKDRSVNFVLVGKTTAGSDLVLKLPKGLISGPFLGVWVDNQQTRNFTITEEALVNVVTIPISPLTEKVGIVGTTVVPEFGPVAITVLAISIIAIVAFTRFRPVQRLG